MSSSSPNHSRYGEKAECPVYFRRNMSVLSSAVFHLVCIFCPALFQILLHRRKFAAGSSPDSVYIDSFHVSYHTYGRMYAVISDLATILHTFVDTIKGSYVCCDKRSGDNSPHIC
ncbi:hypothetical protein ElyMa_000286600 [Elysia marginata]|uniref:Uncharacterized protein n=1 Tax=Elysia marginata TaxID=1093978 RepID=A0AAV4F6H2_9GAST|nr:hypothetical protein ElyMa_000286600 [Elysia marginata]